MKEIGGYLELENFAGKQYHKNAIGLNCGRGCIKYLVELRRIRKIWIPDFICDAVINAFNSKGVRISIYHINEHFLPTYDFDIKNDEWLFLNDYYGQLQKKDVEEAKEYAGGRLIVDETQGFFNEPYDRVDTFYSCRKWFGVADGAFLITGDRKKLTRALEKDESHKRMLHVLGRYERGASEFYEFASRNNAFFQNEPAKQMSLITENLLRAIDYDEVISRRRKNWDYVDSVFGKMNILSLHKPYVPFMYPLLVEGVKLESIRTNLAKKEIYIPVLWPNVKTEYGDDYVAGRYESAILPLPVDQRYDEKDMLFMSDKIRKELDMD